MYTPPQELGQDCNGDIQYVFCEAGAQIVGLEVFEWLRGLSELFDSPTFRCRRPHPRGQSPNPRGLYLCLHSCGWQSCCNFPEELHSHIDLLVLKPSGSNTTETPLVVLISAQRARTSKYLALVAERATWLELVCSSSENCDMWQ